jgi:alkylated DNA repair protein alkB homolog 1
LKKTIQRKIINDDNKFFFQTAIRWANIGKQYDWPNRCYFSPNIPLVPTLINLGVDGVNQFEMMDYNPEAVICNFYDKKDQMGGHLDDGEPDQLHPIISYSFGLSCVFLIGGKTKQIKPHTIRLDGGDVLLMSREAR